MKRRNKLLLLFALGTTLTSVGTRAYDESVFTANTLFIEAEDADYGHGKYVTTTKIGMDGPYDGGSYNGLGDQTDADFDWHSGGPNGQAYRPNTGLSAGKEKGSAGNNRGTFQVKDWWTLGWNGSSDWYNYTRPFPATPTDYAVFGHLASGGNPINIELDQITAGVGQDDTQQVKQKLGVFSPGRATAGWDSLELFPMTDDNGKLITVKLSGKITLRAAMQAGSAEDLDYFAFVPVTGPLFSATWSPAAVNIALTDTTSPVDTSSIAVKLNGNAITTTFTKGTNGVTSTSYLFPALLVAGTTNKIDVTYKDGAGKSYSNSSSYVTPTYIALDPATAVTTADKTKTGFIWNMSTVDSVGNYAQNSNARTEAQLQGLLGDNTADPNAQGVALAVATPSADTTAPFHFEIDGPIDLEKAGAGFGMFPSKTGQMPGSPGVNGTSNQAAEAIGYLDLQPGYYTMAVGSDDGFRVTTGANLHDAFATVLGQFDGGRGYAPTYFSFAVSKAGVYPFRLIWENGGGGSNVEWTSVAADGTAHLIGDKSDPLAIKSYRAVTGGAGPAYVKSFSPTSTTVPAPSTKPDINIVLSDGSTTVDKTSITLKVNGASVTPTITKTNTNTTIDYTPTTAFAENSPVAVEFAFKDSAGASRTVDTSFVTEITTNSFPVGTLFVEAEDADYNHAQYVTTAKIGMDGPYPGGSYNGLGTRDNDENYDWFTGTSGPDGQAYRPDTGLSAGKENGSQGLDRGTFQITDGWTLGWNDAGEWENYTRPFPAGPKNYKVYGHLASGGSPINIRMEQITAGVGQHDTNQVKKFIGRFNPGRATAGWDNLEIFPLVDDAGKQAIVTFDGKTTFRVTMEANSNEDMDYFAFVPTTDTGGGTTGGTTAGTTGGGKLSISSVANGSVTITSDKGGTIQGSPSLGTGANWQTVGPAPQTVSATTGNKFFRTKD